MDHVKINVEDAAEDSLRFRTSGTCAAMYMYSTSSCTVLVPAQAGGEAGRDQCTCCDDVDSDRGLVRLGD